MLSNRQSKFKTKKIIHEGDDILSATIDGNKVFLTRGDTFIAQVSITQAGEPYTPQEGDSIRFALKHPAMTAGKRNYEEATPVILKNIPIDTMLLQIDPSDTKELTFGDYVYDIEITLANGIVDTFITASPFVITPEVH